MVGLRDLYWIQRKLNVLIGLFRRNILVANVAKYKAITCQIRTFWSGMLEEVVG